MNILVNIDVDDLERAVAFYGEAFGLRIGRRLGPGVVEMTGLAAPVYLLEKARGSAPVPGSRERRDYARHWTPVHLDIVVEDIEADVARALGAGATLEEPVRTSRWGKLALMADPFGHGFCLVQFLNRGYDEIATDAPGG